MQDPGSPPRISDRQKAILRLIGEQGFVTIDRLANEFQVSAQTVRRDIIAMDATGLLQRFHGGAAINPKATPLRLGHGYKKSDSLDAKRVIAEKAAALVPPGSTIFLDVGTTIETAANMLNRIEGLTVFTNSMYAATAFRPEEHDIYLLGGIRGGADGSLVGENVLTALADLRLDFAFIGCSAIEENGSVMDFDLRKIAIKQMAMRVARCNCLLVASAKFSRSALARIAMKDAFDHVLSEH
jgi:DeoR family glycerol-3-phosphate regulon repressor